MNPTNAVLKKDTAAIEGELRLALSSGQAASAFSIQNFKLEITLFVLQIFMGNWNLFNNTLRAQGIDVRFADPSDLKISEN